MNKPGTALRVAIVEETAKIGGAEINILNLLSVLDARQVELLVFVPHNGAYEEALRSRGAQVHRLNTPHFYSISFFWRNHKVLNPVAIIINFFLLLIFAHAIRTAAREYNIEILHTNGILAHLAGGLASRWLGCSCVWHMQDIIEPHHRLRRWFFRRAAAILADRIIAISPPVSEQLGPALHPRVVLLPYGLDLTRFQNGPKSCSSGFLRDFAGDRLLVGLTGRFARWKGQHIFLEAARQLVEQRSDLAFVLVGDASLGEPDYATQLHMLVEDVSLRDYVLFAGWQSEMPRVYKQLDILVLASIEPEPFGLVLLEGMASRLPVIATNHGGPAYFIQDGITGLLVPPADPYTLAQQIGRLADSPALRNHLADNARLEVESHYNIFSHVVQLIEIYRDLWRVKHLR